METVPGVHLHVHTEYSLLDGMCRIDPLIKRVKELGMNAVAITDHGTMHGIIDFYKAAKKAKIKPILGLETYVVPNMVAHETLKEELEEHKKKRKKMTSKEKTVDDKPLSVKDALNRLATEDEAYFGNSIAVQLDDGNIDYRFGISHLLLLAATNEGYYNLIKIASESQLRGFYYKPRVDKALLKKYGKGIIATSACRGGEIPRLILRGRIDLAEKLALEYSEIFDAFYLEIQPSNNAEQRIINQALIEMSEKLSIPLVATSDAHYVKEQDSGIHEVLLAVSTGSTMDDEDRFQFDEHVNYLMTEEEFLSYGIPQIAIDNSLNIANMCNVELDLDKLYLPAVAIPEGYTPRQYIEKLCQDGMYEFFASLTKQERDKRDVFQYIKQLQYELDVIEQKGYIDYFLIVRDYIHFAKTNGIYVGPGRGSAVGCLVSFCLGITALDPIEHELIFERFLNPERVSLPDIDVDFEEYIDVPELFISGRQRVIEYVINKYGKDCICQILAMGTMGTRAVLKDVGRALNIDHAEINYVNKFVPADAGMQWSLHDCLYGNEEKERQPIPEMVDFAEKYPRLFEVALMLEGMPRHTGIHAAGVVISPVPVSDLLPLCRGGDGEVVAQFDKDLLEKMGLLKMDFLGLRTLGVLHRAVDAIKQRHGIEIDIDAIPLNDPKSLTLIKNGYTDGVFQIESDGMKKMFRDMNEVHFADIVAGLSLYRPGPMDFIPQYIACKNGYTDTTYLFPELEPILRNTYGIMVYQEQIIRIATDLGGYTAGQADEFRRAIGKKDEELIKAQIAILVNGDPEKGITGLLKRGIPAELAYKLGAQIVEFAKYSFNKSHAAGYAVITMQTAYLKAHYPLEYMTYLISSFIGKDDEKIVKYINEAKRMGITILPPDINMSDYEFKIEGNAIRYGLGSIKGLNKSAIAITRERETNGLFKDMEDFMNRFDKKSVNKKAVDSLALSGALTSISQHKDRFEVLKEAYGTRGDTVPEDFLQEYAKKSGNDFVNIGSAKQLYSKLMKNNSLEELQILQIEQLLLGMYLSGHPLSGKAEPIDWTTKYEGAIFDVVGIITGVRKTQTKKKDDMAFVTLETLEGTRDIVVFPKAYEENKNKLEVGGIRVLTLECKVKWDDPGSLSYIAKNIKYYRGGTNHANETEQ